MALQCTHSIAIAGSLDCAKRRSRSSQRLMFRIHNLTIAPPNSNHNVRRP